MLKLRGIVATMEIATKPCEGNCMIFSLGANMEYDDGSSAENANGVSHDRT